MITVRALSSFVHHHIDARRNDHVEMSEALAKDLAKVGLVSLLDAEVEEVKADAADRDSPPEKNAPTPSNKKAPEPKNKGA